MEEQRPDKRQRRNTAARSSSSSAVIQHKPKFSSSKRRRHCQGMGLEEGFSICKRCYLQMQLDVMQLYEFDTVAKQINFTVA
jgi:hypothetical protein